MRTAPLLVLAALAACHKTPPAVGPSVDVRLDMADRSSVEMESAVSAPLEFAIARVPHVARIQSTSRDGSSRIHVELESGTSLDDAVRSVETSVRGAAGTLPPSAGAAIVTAGAGAVVRRWTWIDQAALAGVQADGSGDPTARVAQVQGVARVDSCGNRGGEVRVDVDLEKAAAFGWTVSNVVHAIEALHLSGGGDATSLAPIALGFANGAAIRLSDVANVVDGREARACRAFDDRGVVEEVTVYARVGADLKALGPAIDASLRLADVAVGSDVRPFNAARVITVDVDPSVDLRVFARLREVVAAVSGVGHFVIEVGDPADLVAPSGARILLESNDVAIAGRVTKALTELPFVRTSGEANATVELVAADRAALKGAGEQLFQRLVQRGELVAKLGVDERIETKVEVDAEAAKRIGVPAEEIAIATSALRGRVVGSFVRGDRSVPIVVRAVGQPDALSVRTASGQVVPLGVVAKRTMIATPSTLLHEGQFSMIGARVHTTDVAGLAHMFAPPEGVTLRVFAE